MSSGAGLDGHERSTVNAQKQPAACQQGQVRANGDLGHAEARRELGHLDLTALLDKTQDLVAAVRSPEERFR